MIAPASVKYQWKTEIEKFTGHSVQVIDGLLPRRKQLYAAPAFFNLSSYELILRDIKYMHEMRPDLIILDEAQRIRNWATATARTIKQLKSRYAFVLTGTPLENKLEELYSVVEFVDGRRLGPAFRFLHEHRIEDEKGKLLGYRGLDRIHQKLEPILLRRTRKEVLTELPPRTDQIFRVPLTPQQAEPYWEQSDILARLMRKWERQGWLSEIDLRRITCCIQNMRMLCNSTFLFDKTSRHSPKLDEFREIIRELAIEEDRKVVVFSEYERMTHLAGEELAKLGIGFVSLHGGVPRRKRGALMEKFRHDPACKVFLSTDAGGVGLNLQAASAVINFEPPWNPARLEQRIGRVHRLGQSRPVQVIHFLTTGSIEERVWETLRLKKSLFAGVFDSPAAEVSFAALGKKSVLQAVKEIFAEAAPPGAAARASVALACAPEAAAGWRAPGSRRTARSRRPLPGILRLGRSAATRLRPRAARPPHQPSRADDSPAGIDRRAAPCRRRSPVWSAGSPGSVGQALAHVATPLSGTRDSTNHAMYPTTGNSAASTNATSERCRSNRRPNAGITSATAALHAPAPSPAISRRVRIRVRLSRIRHRKNDEPARQRTWRKTARRAPARTTASTGPAPAEGSAASPPSSTGAAQPAGLPEGPAHAIREPAPEKVPRFPPERWNPQHLADVRLRKAKPLV